MFGAPIVQMHELHSRAVTAKRPFAKIAEFEIHIPYQYHNKIIMIMNVEDSEDHEKMVTDCTHL